MTTEASPTPGGAPRRVAYATNVYVGVVAAVGVCLTAAAIRLDGIVVQRHLLGGPVLLACWRGGWARSDRRWPDCSLSFTGIVMLAAMALVGPAGAGIVGMIMGPFDTAPRPPARARVQLRASSRRWASSVVPPTSRPGVSPGAPGRWARGRSSCTSGIPVLVADVVQFVVNLVLLAIVRPARRGRSRCAPRSGESSGTAGSGPARLRHHRLHHGRALGPGRPRLGQRLPHPPAAARRAVGLPASTPRRSRATSGPCTCSWRRSRPRPPTWPATARGSRS